MALDPARVETVTFDSFTTLVDVNGPTRRALEPHLENPDPVVRLWRHRAIEYRMVSTYVGHYETYEETTRDALEYALAVHGVELSEGEIDDVAAVFEELDVFGDVVDGMTALYDAGYDLYVVSNGTPELLEGIVAAAGIGGLVEDTISAHEIRTYKPAERFYRHAAERTGTPTGDVLHVAAPWYDVYGAMFAGMQAVWVNRTDGPWEAFDGAPDATVASLTEVAGLL